MNAVGQFLLWGVQTVLNELKDIVDWAVASVDRALQKLKDAAEAKDRAVADAIAKVEADVKAEVDRLVAKVKELEDKVNS